MATMPNGMTTGSGDVQEPEGDTVANMADAIDLIAFMIRRIKYAKTDKIGEHELDELEAFAQRLREQ